MAGVPSDTRALSRAALFVLAVSLTTPDAPSQGLFVSAELVDLTERPTSLCVDDFNRDGRPDVAVVHEVSDEVTVLLNDPEDEPQELLARERTYAVGASPLVVVSGDLDEDDGPDLVVVNKSSSTISVLLNRGDGQFRVEDEYSVLLSPRVARIGDLDRDGHLDVVVGSAKADDLLVFLGDGRGDLDREGQFRLNGNPHSMGIADFDEDGRPDVVAVYANGGVGGINFLEGRGDGTFRDAVRTRIEHDGDVSPRFLVIEDFDRDGRPDLGVISDEEKLFFLEFRSDGTFRVRYLDTVPVSRAYFLASADFDRDGTADLVTPLETGGEHGVRVYRSDGDGSFSRYRDIFLDGEHRDAQLVDMDGNGVLDLVGAQQSPSGITLIRGSVPGRYRLRETVDIDDEPRALAALDFDGDGQTELVALTSDALFLVAGERDGDFDIIESGGIAAGGLKDMVVADFNRDGRRELAISDSLGMRILMVAVDRSGDMEVTQSVGVPELPAELAAADFDGDGYPDLAVTHSALPKITIIPGPGKEDGAEAVHLDVGIGQTAIEAADLNGDRLPDLAVGSAEGTRVLLGDGRGAFPGGVLLDEYRSPRALAAGDVNGDGRSDLAIGRSDRVYILYDPSSPDDGPRDVVDTKDPVESLLACDFEGDGRAEVLVGVDRKLLVIRRASGGDAEIVEDYSVGSLPRAIVIEDLTRNGLLDAATADFGSERLTVLFGTRKKPEAPEPEPSFRRGDVDGNGEVRITDAILLLDWLFRGGEAASCPDAADSNDDGGINLTDVLVILGYLFRGGSAPVPPGPLECGEDIAPDNLPECRGSPCP